jgi:hypothetical protein
MMAVGLALACALSSEAMAQGPGQKPFENIYRRPNISPYNQVSNFATNPLMAPNIYQQIIVPQQQQQQQQIEQLNQQRQLGRLQGQVKQIQSDSRSRHIDPTIRPTGHASTFQNYSHYYQQR